MKRILAIIVTAIFASFSAIAQEGYKSNGPNNLESLCPDPASCIYTKVPGVVTYPINEPNTHWKLYNMEIATKKTNGHFIATGDMVVSSLDTAAILNFVIQFYDKNDELLFAHRVANFEFYNEPKHAEPLLIHGILNGEVAENVEFVGFDVESSKVIPYYEMKSSCYHACKNHKLNEAMRDFKKAK